jgi:hypothetical protein
MESNTNKSTHTGDDKLKTLILKDGSLHNCSTTYTRVEIRRLMEKYYPHRLKR